MKDSVVDHNMSNLTSASGEVSASPTSFLQEQTFASAANQEQPRLKKKRGLPGNPDPDAEVIALSPKTLLTTHRFICEICSKGFQRDQNLQLHRRGHNLPWKLKRKTNKEIVRKKVYVCPEPSCPHHESSRALGDLTGIKKHFSRKHGEKKWKCEKCSKRYAVQSDWKAHSKICGTREYGCDCGTIFSRRDSFITHRAFCDALLKETTRRAEPIITVLNSLPTQQITPTNFQSQYFPNPFSSFSVKSEVQLQEQNGHNVPQWLGPPCPNPTNVDPSSAAAAATALDHHDSQNPSSITPTTLSPFQNPTGDLSSSSSHMSATALLQKASQMGATAIQTQKKSGTSDLSSNQHIDSYKAASSISQSPFLLREMGIRPCLVGGSSSPSSSSLQLGFSRTVGSQFSDGGGGFTRDFLGIDEFGPRELTEMPGFEHISSSSSSTSSRFDLQWHGLN